MKSFDTLVGKTTRAAIADDRQIKQVISRIVPERTLQYIEFCRVEGGRLRLTINGAAWVSRLRFTERQIIDALRANGYDVHTASYHVAPSEIPKLRKTTRDAQRAVSGAASLEAAANSIADTRDGSDGANGERLRQELLKLARTMRGK